MTDGGGTDCLHTCSQNAAAGTADGLDPEGRAVYEASLPDDDQIPLIRTTAVEGRTLSIASEAVRTGGQCAGEVVFRAYGAPVGAAAPDAAGEVVFRAYGAPVGAAAPDAAGTMRPPIRRSPKAGHRRRPAHAPAGQEPQIDIPPPPPDPDEERPDASDADERPPDGTATTTAEPETPPAVEDDDDDEGGCLIATAAYGTEIAPQVRHLRGS